MLGACALGAAFAFGSRPLAVAGLGLVLAGAVARAWAAFAKGPVAVEHVADPSPATEGDEVALRITARRESRVPAASIVARGRLGRLGPYGCRLRNSGREAAGELALGHPPRGRYPISDASLELAEPLGLERVVLPLAPATSVVVHPRLVELDGLFSDQGRLGPDGKRLRLRLPSGFDFHSVREYERGESLRRVHWPTTARQGRLMVKNLEDPLRDGVCVVLDCDPAGAVGKPPESSFDTAVRAAGSLLRASVLRGRRGVLVTTGRRHAAVEVASARAFPAALDVLADAEPDALHGLARALDRALEPAARASELVVVTSALDGEGARALIASGARRVVSVVWVDAASFGWRPTRADRCVLRLVAAGIPVAVVRRGDDLAAALGRPRIEERARA